MTATLEDIQSISINKWGTLNTAASPNRLPEGHSPDNQNVWMDEKPGSLVTANGYIKLGTSPSNNPTTFLMNYFKTSDGSQTVILSDGSTVWKTTNYVDYTSIKTGLSAFFQLRGAVIRGKLWLTNGSDPVMTYDGTTLTILDGIAGTPNVPLGKYIAYHDERVWLYGISGDPSSLRFSDLADSSGTEITPDNSAAWPTDNEVQVSEGDDDIGTGLFLYRGYLYASKAFSIWRIVGYDEYTYTRVKTRASTGTRFQESVQILDNLVHFIGVDGLYTFDGEDAKRISDIIDPASSDPGVFAFRNLQQPLLNNQFWTVSNSADFAAGIVPANLDTSNDRLSLVPADDTQANFNAGTKTNVTADDNPGFLQLARSAGSSGGALISIGKNAFLDSSLAMARIGQNSYITDGNPNNVVGFVPFSLSFMSWTVDLTPDIISEVIVSGYNAPAGGSILQSQIEVNTGAYQAPGASNGTWVNVGSLGLSFTTVPTDHTINFPSVSAVQVRLLVYTVDTQVTIAELYVYQSAYEASGKFVSKTIDYSVVPISFGQLAASIQFFGDNFQFFTQSSADGLTWEAESLFPLNTNGSSIGSTVQRYLRWGVYLFSAFGNTSTIIDKVYVGGAYISEIHDTNGNILQWAAFQMDAHKFGQTIDAYYRAATTSGGVSAASWIPIVPGAVPGAAVTDVFVQVLLILSTVNSTLIPYVDSFTVNWVAGASSGVNTLQNVASFIWLNRYWLSAATLEATANDIVIVRGKATFESPWHKKDFTILSFARFQDYFIAGSSVNGDIYRLEYGYSKDGAAMDSYFETADFSGNGGFLRKICELSVNLDRTGPYSLSVGYSIDGGITWTDKLIDLTRATLTTNISIVKKINISFMGDKVRFRFRINAADQPFSVDSMEVFYRLTPFRGSLN